MTKNARQSPTDSSSSLEQDPIIQRWLTALLRLDSTLPRPVASAMIQNVAAGRFGNSLRQLEENLMLLEVVQVEDLTGSEAKTLLAILSQMHSQIEQLQDKIRQLWDQPS